MVMSITIGNFTIRSNVNEESIDFDGVSDISSDKKSPALVTLTSVATLPLKLDCLCLCH